MTDTTDSTVTRDNTRALLQWLGVVLLAFLATAAVMAWLIVPMLRPGAPPPPGSPAATAALAEDGYASPDFRLAALGSDRELGPPDYQGKVVVLDFWATWCGPCKIQAEYLEEMHEEWTARGVQFLAVNVGEDRETVQRYVADTPFSYPVLMDPSESVTSRYPIHGLPTLMVIDREGAVTYLKTGITDPDTLAAQLREAGA